MENKQNIIEKKDKVHRTCKVVHIPQIQIPKHFLKIKKYVKKFEINGWEMDKTDLEKFNISKLTPNGYRVTLWKNLVINPTSEKDRKLLSNLKYDFPNYDFRLLENDKNSKTSLLVDKQLLIIDWTTYSKEYLENYKKTDFYDIIEHEVSNIIKNNPNIVD